MNKLTKIGLTALAGSLVATSSMAGSLSATGAASMGLTNVSGTQTTQSANAPLGGNGWSMGDSVTFSGSGETDQGYAIGVSYELDGGTFDAINAPALNTLILSVSNDANANFTLSASVIIEPEPPFPVPNISSIPNDIFACP